MNGKAEAPTQANIIDDFDVFSAKAGLIGACISYEKS